MGDILGSSPSVDTNTDDLVEDKAKAKKSRAALLETEGGIAGQELQPDQVKKRDTLLGN